MPWEEEQDRLTEEARLFLASPEAVFEQLKKFSTKKEWWDTRDRFEGSLIERNEPLINLALACYGKSQEVFKALYKHSLEPARDEADARYKEGLRIGCLSNTTERFLVAFPKELIGSEETERLLNQGTDNEVTALIRNPCIDDDLLATLYRRADMFARMPDERWLRLVSISCANERLVTNEPGEDMPDLGFMRIHDAIFGLLEVAPVQTSVAHILYRLLDSLNPWEVDSPKKIDHVLTRWATLEDRDARGKAREGYFTSLPFKDEFRCIIAALYGSGYVNGKRVIHGSQNAEDVAFRCAYYGKGDITAQQMAAGYKRDRNVFTFAVLFNNNVYERKLRALLEEQYLGAMSDRYFKYLQQKRKRWPYDPGPLSQELRDQAAESGIQFEAVQPTTTDLGRRLNNLTAEVSKLKRDILWVSCIAIAIMIAILYKFPR